MPAVTRSEQSIACTYTATASFHISGGSSTLTQVPAAASIQLQKQTPLLQLAELSSPLRFPQRAKLCQQKALFFASIADSSAELLPALRQPLCSSTRFSSPPTFLYFHLYTEKP